MGGGGSSSGGAIVQSTSPWAAMAAGQYGVQAAYQASQAAATQTANALNSVNQAYNSAALTLQPQTQVGVQALDQMSQYLGLNPYMPSTAPTAPVKPTLESELGKVTNQQTNQYILGNTINGSYTTGAGTFGNSLYIGGSGTDNASSGGAAGPGQGGAGNFGYITAAGSPVTNPSGAMTGLGEGNVRDSAKGMLAQQALTTDMPAYDTAQQKYTTDLANYNQDQGWAQQYGTPLTQQQITDNITNQPGYQAQLEQGTNAIQNSASSKGYLGSGRILKELMNFGQNTLSQYYGNTLSNLSNIAGMGANASSQLAKSATQTGDALAGLYTNLGDTQANAALAAGNAQSQAIVAANQNYNIMGASSGGGGLGGIGEAIGGIASVAKAFSSKELKDKIETVDTADILENIKSLELDKWKYKGIDHEFIGPYAEQFKELFKVGDGKTIDMVSMVGVLLGAVKELDKRIQKLSVEGEQ